MPTLFKMSDEKQAAETPAAVVVETQEPRVKKTKKYAIIAVSVILGVAIILTAILVGVYMFTAAQKDIIKYTLEFSENAKQEVVSDPNTNIVQFHLTYPGQEAWIVNDFNKDIQVAKIQTDKETVCYMNALNRSLATDPSKVAKPSKTDMSGNKDSATVTYAISNTPVSDTSFLPKAARDMCKGVSVYWVYPHCAGKTAGPPPNGTDTSPRRKRDTPCSSDSTRQYNGRTIPCISMCCRTVCACQILSYCTLYSDGSVVCTWYYANCPSAGISANPVYDYYFC